MSDFERKKIARTVTCFQDGCWETKHYSKLTTSLLNISVCIPLVIVNKGALRIAAAQKMDICEMLEYTI